MCRWHGSWSSATVTGHEFRHYPSADIVAAAQRLIVHLGRAQMVLGKRNRRWRVVESVDRPQRLIRAVTLLEIDRRRVGHGGVVSCVRFGQRRGSVDGQATGAGSLRRSPVVGRGCVSRCLRSASGHEGSLRSPGGRVGIDCCHSANTGSQGRQGDRSLGIIGRRRVGSRCSLAGVQCEVWHRQAGGVDATAWQLTCVRRHGHNRLTVYSLRRRLDHFC